MNIFNSIVMGGIEGLESYRVLSNERSPTVAKFGQEANSFARVTMRDIYGVIKY